MVQEVVEIQFDPAFAPTDHVTNLRSKARFAVSSQTHHFVFVAMLWKSEKLRKRSVEEAQRVRELHSAANIDPVAASNTPHAATEVAKTIDGNNGAFVERGSEECAGQVGPMMLDMV